MFRKIKDSPYFKAGVTILICGVILSAFHNWISRISFSVGFETINKTLAPFYIGIIFAFILCPVYNACVKWAYKHMLKNAKRKGFSLGATIVLHDDSELPVTAEDRRKILNAARFAASVVCVCLVVGIVGLLIYFIMPTVVQNGISLVNTLPYRLEIFSNWLSVHFSRFPMLATWVDNLANAGTNDIVEWLQEHVLTGNAASLAAMISNGVLTAVKYVTNAFIGLLIMIYLLNYKETLFAICRKLVAATCGQKRQSALFEFADIVNETFIGFIVGRIIDSSIIGVLTYLILRICDIPFALMISVIVGATNVIPFFGPFIGAVPSVIILLLEEPVAALYFVIIIIVIQQIDGNIIGPKVVGNAIGISSFWVLVAVLIGGGLFGFVGMALGVPVFAVVYRYVDKITTRSLKYKNKAAGLTDYISLETYDIDNDEIQLEPDHKKQESIFVVLKRYFEKTAHKDKGKGSAQEVNDESFDEEENELLFKEHIAGEPQHKSPKVNTHKESR